MAQPIYAQMNTLVRVKETKLLTRAQKLPLIHAADLDSAVRLLHEAGFFAFSAPASPSDFPSALTLEKKGWIAWAQELCPEKNIPALFMLKDTVSLLRELLRQRLTGAEAGLMDEALSIYAPEDLKRLVNDPASEAKAIPERWSKLVREITADYAVHASFQLAEYSLDRFYYQELLHIASELNEPDILAFINTAVDLYHLSVLFQCRKMGIRVPAQVLISAEGRPSDLGGLFGMTEQEQDAFLRASRFASFWEALTPQESLALLDVYADNYLLVLCKKAKLEAFGLLPVCGFLFSKLMEIRDVRAILSGKLWKLPVNEIEKRVRISYEL